MADRLPPPPFWHTPYFIKAMARPDRQTIADKDIVAAMTRPAQVERQSDGRTRLWYFVRERNKWLRVVVEQDGQTVHNAFWDRRFRL